MIHLLIPLLIMQTQNISRTLPQERSVRPLRKIVPPSENKLPFVVNSLQERLDRRHSLESPANHAAMRARVEWAKRMNARLVKDGVVFISEKERRRRKRK